MGGTSGQGQDQAPATQAAGWSRPVVARWRIVAGRLAAAQPFEGRPIAAQPLAGRSVAATPLGWRPVAAQPFAWRPVGMVAAVTAVLHLAVATRFGWHHDEFYYVICGRHPMFGYVDQPPVAPLLARFGDAIGGLLGVRLLAIGAQIGCVLLTATLAARFGGRTAAQTLAAAAVAASPVFVAASMLFGTTVLDQLVWAALFVTVVRALQATRPMRWWVAAGTIGGVGLETKDTVAVLMLGIATGLLCYRRDVLRTPGPWIAAVLAAALAAPNVAWDALHGWPNLTMDRVLSRQQGGALGSLARFPELPLLLGGTALIGIWYAGLRWQAAAENREFRWLVPTTGVVVTLFVAGGGKVYYAAPLLVALFAAGSVRMEAAAWRRLRESGSLSDVDRGVTPAQSVLSVADGLAEPAGTSRPASSSESAGLGKSAGQTEAAQATTAKRAEPSRATTTGEAGELPGSAEQGGPSAPTEPGGPAQQTAPTPASNTAEPTESAVAAFLRRSVQIPVTISFVMALTLGLPVLTPGSTTALRTVNPELMQTYGWPQFVRQVSDAASALPADVPIFAGDFGEAGALAILGPTEGLRRPVYSGHDSYTYWGPPAGSPETVLCVGKFNPGELRRFWSQVDEIAPITLPDGLKNSETVQHAAIYVCRQPQGTWAQLWPQLSHID